MGWRLLLTRPHDDCQALAAALATDGVYSQCMPLLQFERLPLLAPQRAMLAQLAAYSAVLVVSKPAASLGLTALHQMGCSIPQGPAWFTVGAGSAAILQAAGVQVHYPAGGDDSEALLALPAFQQALSQPEARLLIWRADEGREWLAQHVRKRGVAVDYLPLYQRRAPSYPADELWRRVQAEQLNGLVVSSGQGFAHLQQLAGERWPALAELPLFVPSERVAQLALAAGGKVVINCQGANTLALQAALAKTPKP